MYYDLSKRAYFTTLGELRSLLHDMDDETIVCTGGVYGSWLHVEIDDHLISFDDESLAVDYEMFLEDTCSFSSEEAGELEEEYSFKQMREHEERLVQRSNFTSKVSD